LVVNVVFSINSEVEINSISENTMLLIGVALADGTVRVIPPVIVTPPVNVIAIIHLKVLV
jgi:hypothetical protein